MSALGSKNQRPWTYTKERLEGYARGSISGSEEHLLDAYLWDCGKKFATGKAKVATLTPAQEAERLYAGEMIVERVAYHLRQSAHEGKDPRPDFLAKAAAIIAKRRDAATCDLTQVDAAGRIAEALALTTPEGASAFASKTNDEKLAGHLPALDKAVSARDVKAIVAWEKACRPEVGAPCTRKAVDVLYAMDDWEAMVEHFFHWSGAGRDHFERLAAVHGRERILDQIVAYIVAHPTLDDHPHDSYVTGSMFEMLEQANRLGCDRGPDLVRMLDSRSHTAIAAATRNLVKHRCDEAEPKWRALLGHRDGGTRLLAARALGELGGKSSLGPLRAIADRDPYCSTDGDCERRAVLAGVPCACFPVRDAAQLSVQQIEARRSSDVNR